MKRHLYASFLFVFLFFFSGSLFAQMGVGIQAGAAVPTGDLSDRAKLGWGGQGNFEYLASPNLSLSASVGYYLWGAKSDINDLLGIADFTFSTVPILAGAKYLFMEGDLHPYLGADLGLHILNTKISSSVFGVNMERSTSETKFGFAPMAGLRLHMPPNVDLDLNLSYNIITTSGSNTTYLGIIAGALVALD